MQTKLTQWIVAAGLVGGLLCSSSASLATTVDKCQADLEKASNKFRSQVEKALTFCADKIRVEKAKEENVPGSGSKAKAADLCQGKLQKVFDVGGLKLATDFRDKFYADINKAFTAGTVPHCNGLNDLYRLGYIPAGGTNQAPSPDGTVWGFARNWMAVDIVRSALNDQLSRTADFLNLMQDMIEAPDFAGGAAKNKEATNCALADNCDPATVLGCRPDLCNFRVQCREHACTLAVGSQTGTNLVTVGLSATPALIGHSTMTFCKMEGFGFELGNGGEGYLITGGTGRLILPPKINGQKVCIDNVRQQGFCSCSGNFLNRPKNTVFCQDHIISDGDDCAGTPTGPNTEEECYCVNGFIPTNVRCGDGFPRCVGSLFCGQTNNGDPCHANSTHTAVKIANSGLSVSGDCMALNTTQFKILDADSTCSNASDCCETGLTACSLIGTKVICHDPMDNTTLTTHGASKDDWGDDCVPCTEDDPKPPNASASVPFTTGQSAAQIKDALDNVAGSASNGTGKCVAQTNHQCIEDANCHTTDNLTDVCDGTQALTDAQVPQPMGPDDPTVGAGLSNCTKFESSTLSGLSLVGAFPAIDSGLGDLVTTFKITCQ